MPSIDDKKAICSQDVFLPQCVPVHLLLEVMSRSIKYLPQPLAQDAIDCMSLFKEHITEASAAEDFDFGFGLTPSERSDAAQMYLLTRRLVGHSSDERFLKENCALSILNSRTPGDMAPAMLACSWTDGTISQQQCFVDTGTGSIHVDELDSPPDFEEKSLESATVFISGSQAPVAVSNGGSYPMGRVCCGLSLEAIRSAFQVKLLLERASF